MASNYDISAIDAVVNLWTPEVCARRNESFRGFFVDKIGVGEKTYEGITLYEMLRQMVTQLEAMTAESNAGK